MSRMNWTKEQILQFSARWLALRKRYNLTREQFAKMMGIAVKNAMRVESGRYIPSDRVLIRFGEAEMKLKRGEAIERSLDRVPWKD